MKEKLFNSSNFKIPANTTVSPAKDAELNSIKTLITLKSKHLSRSSWAYHKVSLLFQLQKGVELEALSFWTLVAQFTRFGTKHQLFSGIHIITILVQVKWETIDKFPKSRLQKLRYATSEGEPFKYLQLAQLKFSAEILALCDSFSLSTREFFFDRSPRIFENILGLYRLLRHSGLWRGRTIDRVFCIRKGELHLTESVCPRDFLGELEYWGLSALHLGQPQYLSQRHNFNLK